MAKQHHFTHHSHQVLELQAAVRILKGLRGHGRITKRGKNLQPKIHVFCFDSCNLAENPREVYPISSVQLDNL